MTYADRSDPKFGKRGILRLRFVYGSDVWDFGYFTIYFIQQLGIGPVLNEPTSDAIEELEHFGIFELCAKAERSRMEMTDFELDGRQTHYFIKIVDHFCNLLVHPDGELLADNMVGFIREKHGRFETGKALMDFYLPIATDVLADFKDHYKTSEHGKPILKFLWDEKK